MAANRRALLSLARNCCYNRGPFWQRHPVQATPTGKYLSIPLIHSWTFRSRTPSRCKKPDFTTTDSIATVVTSDAQNASVSRAPRKVFIKTHGCQMNEYDSARMLDLLRESHGATLVDSPEQADVLLLNTCSIREKAQEKVFHQLGRWRSLKEANPDVRIAVGGCVASQEGDAIGKRAPTSMSCSGPRPCINCRPCWTAPAAMARRLTSAFRKSRNSTGSTQRSHLLPGISDHHGRL